MTTPSWLWGEISRERAEELILGGDRKDGTFLVRARPKHDGQFLLTLVFRGRATHHLLVKNTDSLCWTINKKQFGSCNTLASVVAMLREPVAGWPVVLKTEVINPEPGLPQLNELHREIDSLHTTNAPVVAAICADTHQIEPQLQNTAVEATGTSDVALPYFHGQISRDESEDIVNRYAATKNGGDINGLWLVRQRAGKVADMSELVILVGYEGRCTHHLCQTQADGFIKVNGKDANRSQSLPAVLEYLKSKPVFWPVDMNEFVPTDWKAPNTVVDIQIEDVQSIPATSHVEPVVNTEDEESLATGEAQHTNMLQTVSTTAMKDMCQVISGPTQYDLPSIADVQSMLDTTPKLSISMKRPDLSVDMGFAANVAYDGKPPIVSTYTARRSIAELAGLRLGDVIVQVNSVSTMSLSTSRIKALFEGDSLELALLVARPPFKKSSQVYDEEEDKFPEDGYYTDE